MNDEMISSLRICGRINSANDNCIAFHDGCCEAEPVCMYELMGEAADAIEELQSDNAALNGTVSNLIQQIEELSKPRWIPVTERLPEEKTYVLILFDTIAGKMQGVCFLYKDDDGHNCWTWLDRLGKNLFDIQPTHWMPLPSTDGLNET